MDQDVNRSGLVGTVSNKSAQTLPGSTTPDLSQEISLTQPTSQESSTNQKPTQPPVDAISSATSQSTSEISPPTTHPDISSVVTTSLNGKKNKKVLWIILGMLLLMAISVGGYFFYIGLSEKQSGPDQSLTSLPSPILLPTLIPTPIPTSAPVPSATGDATLSLCGELVEQATQSAHQEDFCRGVFCTSLETEEECLEVDVVSTDAGMLSTKNISDGIGDCVWDELASGFGSKCKVKYD